MTLIAAVKHDNQGCIISDFRLTQSSTKLQQDNAFKFISFDNRLMIYMSGKTVSLLPLIQELLPTIYSELTFENVDEINGPLLTILKKAIDGKPKEFESSIIGVYLNQPTNSFKMFRVDFLYSNSLWKTRLVPDSDFDWQVIGSGEILMQKEFFPSFVPFSFYEVFKNGLSPKLNQKGKIFHYSLRTVAEGIQTLIKSRLSTLGKSVYRKLGISPVTNISLISGSSLCVLGGEYEITKYTVDKEKEVVKYSLEKETSNRAKLVDKKSNQTLLAHQTDGDFPDFTKEDLRFDPESLEGEDEYYYQFTLSQQILQLDPGDPMIIVRVVKETKLLHWFGFEFPVRNIIKTQEKTFKNIFANEIEEIRININEDLENNYWDNIDLFNTDWLDKHIGRGNPFTQ